MNEKEQPDPQVTQVLVSLRTKNGLTQSDVGKIFGVDYKAVGRWETGESRPRPSHRAQFIRYLLESLKLRQDLRRFWTTWEELAVGEWGWTDLDKNERWIATLAARSRESSVLHPSLPPFPNAKQLIGRHQLLVEIVDNLGQGNRLALVGMPGVGKTALSLAVAEHPAIQARFNGGILWGHLGQDPSVEAVLVRWGEKLGEDISSLATVRKMVEAIRDIIDARPVLIIIDDAWALNPVLQLTCGGINSAHLLTTRLHDVARQYVMPKRVYRVPELEPEPANELLQQLAPMAYRVNSPKAEALVAVVGGLPLALVLLGGFLDAKENRYYADTQVAALNEMQETTRRLNLAQSRLGSSEDRALTLRQVMDFSLEDLPVPKQRAFWSLGAFAAKPSDFSRRAGQYVADCNIDTLTELLDRNLVEVAGAENLALHQVLSDYARQFCSDAANDRHRDFYVFDAKEHMDDFESLWAIYEQVKWAWRRQAERDPFDPSFLALMYSLDTFQEYQGLLHDRQEILEFGINILTMTEDDDAMIAGLVSMGRIRLELGETQKAIEDFGLALTTAQHTGDILAQAICYKAMANANSQLGQSLHAIELLQSALEALDSRDDGTPTSDLNMWDMHRASCFNNLGIAYDTLGDKSTALEYYLYAKQTQDDIEDAVGLSATLGNIGMLYSQMDKPEEALEYYEQALSIHQQIGDKIGEAYDLNHMGSAYVYLDQVDRGLEFFNLALDIGRKAGAVIPQATSLHLIGSALADLDDNETALDNLLQALALREKSGEAGGLAGTLSRIGDVYAAIRADDPRALEMQHRALNIALQMEDKWLEYDIRSSIVDIAIADKNRRLAVQELSMMVRLAEEYGIVDADIPRSDLIAIQKRE